MKLNNFFMVCALVLGGAACNSSSPGSNNNNNNVPPVAGLPNGNTLAEVTGPNVLRMTVNGSTCSANSYSNKPCVSLTICDTSTSSSGSCTTVNDILVDTGSYGLRVFKSALPGRTFNQVISAQGGALAECAKFGDGSSEWGPIQKASLVMGGEPAVDVPIQVIDPSFGVIPASCGTPDASPGAAQFNGILGVGLFNEDCGAGCKGTHTSNGMYFTCTGGNTGSGTGTVSCVGGSTTTLADQVQNPVSLLPKDNNGVLVELPTVPSSGSASVDGYLILGVGTESNNTPVAVTTYPATLNADFVTKFNNQTYTSFLDTGSNGLYFQGPSTLTPCSTAWYCPSALQNFTATNVGSGASPSSGTVNFQIANADSLFRSPNHVFSDLGGNGGAMFDWGLPFYFGRNVYLGFDSRNSSLGTGPYWAY